MNHIKFALDDAREVLDTFLSDEKNIKSIESAIELLSSAFKSGGKAISCGNGGSMCDAMHFAEELTGRFRKERAPLPAMAISDAAHITCTANDYGFEHIFSRAVTAWGKNGDTLLAISTSGNSPNIINAVEAAHSKGMKVIGLLGKGGGQLKDMVDIPLIVPSSTSDRIQEIHIKLIHIMIEGIEREIFPENYAE